MSSSRPAFALPNRFLIAGGLLGVATLTLIDRGATRAYASPWIWLLGFTQIAPLLAIALQAFEARPFFLPSRPWCLVAAALAVSLVSSSLASPYRDASLLAAMTPLAGLAYFFLIHDWFRQETSRRSEQLLTTFGRFIPLILIVSLGTWGIGLVASGDFRSFSAAFEHRNEAPLGHSNYTAGLALLMLPWLVALAWRACGIRRALWLIAASLALLMLFTSGSRGGLLGLAALAAAVLLIARLNWRVMAVWILGAAVVASALAYAHPRTRAMVFRSHRAAAEPNISNIQRAAMLQAGTAMGRDRPILGWGTGTTPFAYPHYRATLDGGVENALQLHSTPIQIWADLGGLGVACGAAVLVLLWRSRSDARRAAPNRPGAAASPQPHDDRDDESGSRGPVRTAAFVALAGYGVFALTDYQLDVPIFTVMIALCCAVLARTGGQPASKHARAVVAFAALLALAALALFARRDPTAELNVRALALSQTPGGRTPAIALLNESLAVNPAQEIAHFNLGWLLLISDSVAAEKHFLAAAHLVPEKGGVYFGLGLARLNQEGRVPAGSITHAFAMECLNDPAFLISPWWRQPSIAPFRAATIIELRSLASNAALRLAARNDPRSLDADYVAALAEWLDDRGAPGEILARSHTSSRVRYFAARPSIPDWKDAPVRSYRRERTAYPILMRNLDLAPPLDVFDVQDNPLATGELAFLFPSKGWLPAPLILSLLDESVSPTP